MHCLALVAGPDSWQDPYTLGLWSVLTTLLLHKQSLSLLPLACLAYFLQDAFVSM